MKDTVFYTDLNSTEAVSDDWLHVNSCGTQTILRDTRRVRRRGRVDYHILYIAHGRCFVCRNGEKFEAPAGSMLLYRPREPHDYAFRAADESVSWWVHFTGTGCEALLDRLNLTGFAVQIGLSPEFEQVFGALIRCCQENAPYSQEKCAALLAQLLCSAAQLLAGQENGEGRKRSRIQPALTMLSARFSQEVSVDECADLCRLSRSRFSHLFREATGLALHQYLLELRLSHARELLSDTDSAVQDIAVECGYADQSYFSRIFRRHIGCSPLDYRARTQR